MGQNTLSDNDFRTTLAVCADLLFAARIRGAAQQAGVAVETLSRGDVLERARALTPGLILLDLDTRWLDAPALIRSLKADPALAAVPVVAFVSHVREDAIGAAREAGADRVLARSAFVRQLPDLLRAGIAG